MDKNMTELDRIIRVAAGILTITYSVKRIKSILPIAIGVGILVTGATGYSPVYNSLGKDYSQPNAG